MTAGYIARKIGGSTEGPRVEEVLLAHIRHSEENGLEPMVRYSSLPSRRTLEVLWGATEIVGLRRVESIRKTNVADDTFDQFEDLDEADVFLSHSHRDYDSVMEVASLLVRGGVFPWLAETHLGQGDHINDGIISALTGSQLFILFLTPNALGSRWTGKEYMNARSRGIPIFIVADIRSSLVRSIVESIHHGSRLDDDSRDALQSGAREFISHLLADRQDMVECFTYPEEADSLFSGMRTVGELPKLIRSCRTGNPDDS